MPFAHREAHALQHMLRLGWTLLVGSTLSAAAFHATPLARSPRPALVHTSGKPTAARFAPPAPRVVMTFGDTVSELFGGIAAVLAAVAITQDDGDAVESQRSTEAGETATAEAAESPALARAEQALAEAEKAEAEARAKAEAEQAEAKAAQAEATQAARAIRLQQRAVQAAAEARARAAAAADAAAQAEAAQAAEAAREVQQQQQQQQPQQVAAQQAYGKRAHGAGGCVD